MSLSDATATVYVVIFTSNKLTDKKLGGSNYFISGQVVKMSLIRLEKGDQLRTTKRGDDVATWIQEEAFIYGQIQHPIDDHRIRRDGGGALSMSTFFHSMDNHAIELVSHSKNVNIFRNTCRCVVFRFQQFESPL